MFGGLTTFHAHLLRHMFFHFHHPRRNSFLNLFLIGFHKKSVFVRAETAVSTRQLKNKLKRDKHMEISRVSKEEKKEGREKKKKPKRRAKGINGRHPIPVSILTYTVQVVWPATIATRFARKAQLPFERKSVWLFLLLIFLPLIFSCLSADKSNASWRAATITKTKNLKMMEIFILLSVRAFVCCSAR